MKGRVFVTRFIVSGAKRPNTAPTHQTLPIHAMKSFTSTQRKGSIGSEDGGPLSPWGAAERLAPTKASDQKVNERRAISAQGNHASFAQSPIRNLESRASKSRPASSMSNTSARFKSPSMMQGRQSPKHHHSWRRRRSSSHKQKYSLTLFLKDCHDKEKMQKQIEMEFSEKDHRMWQLGMMSAGTMSAAMVSSENVYYQHKFESWARNVINRERTLLSYNVFASNPNAPSFMPGIASGEILKLEQDNMHGVRRRMTPDEETSKPSTATGVRPSHMHQSVFLLLDVL